MFCSVLGGILLVGGLYGVLWGKGEEQKMNELAEKERLESKEEMFTKSPPTILPV